MLVIGITGTTGAGKTSALRALCRLGALVIDCDAVYHELLRDNSEMKAELGESFPGALSGGEIDRGALSAIVFSDPAALLTLNQITHKYVLEETDRRIADWQLRGGKVAAIDAIALIESGLGGRCDITVAVTAPLEERIARIMARDGIKNEQAALRAGAQKPDAFFEKNCGFLLENTHNTQEEFEERCLAFFSGLIGGNNFG